MVDDNPQDLVHDLAAEAVFGGHPLGRPVIGRAEVIASVSPPALRATTAARTSARTSCSSAAGNVRHERLVELFAARRTSPNGPSRVRRPLLAPPALTGLPVPPQAHRAVPRRARRAGHRTGRRAPVRRRPARRDPRRLGVVAALPGDPGEARDGVQRLQLRLAVRARRARSGSTSGRARTTSPSASP